jgi:hypothetical protein
MEGILWLGNSTLNALDEAEDDQWKKSDKINYSISEAI